MGVPKFILTNAAGATRSKTKPGSLALIKDHINLTALSPLTGTDLYNGPRFPDMSDPYSQQWRAQVVRIARNLKINLKECVYAAVNGPNYETALKLKCSPHWSRPRRDVDRLGKYRS